ncbi:MAG: hypothetical protein H0X25_02000 [Acidobacteriales bacterium]|nr:hypothetical protein [Terriglobales bacterium]
MKKSALFACLSLLLFAVGCGSSSSSSNFTPTGNFTNGSLSGQYTYQVNGIDLSANPSLAYVRAGVFTADGNGNITSGTDDFSENVALTSTFAGTYSVANDGTGTLTLTFPSGTLTFAITLVNSTKVYMTEADVNLTGGGIAQQQSTSAFTNPPDGTYVFRDHSENSSLGPIGAVGLMTVSAGVVTGSEDVNQNGITDTRTLTTGLFNFPDTSGRGTGSYTDSTGFTSTFIYYWVNSNTFNIFCTTPGAFGLGAAERQTGAPFSNTSLSGSYAYGSRGDTFTYLNGVHTVGRFTSDGAGNLSAGAFDVAQDGTPAANVTYTGTYSMDATGRAALVITPTTGGTGNQIYYMVSPSRAFFLVVDPNKVAEGTADLQLVSSFSNSTMNGQFGFLMHGFDTNPPDTFDRVGTLSWNGSGALTLNEFVNVSGSTNSVVLTGTYAVSSNGRTTGSIANLSSNLVFYLVSGSDAYVLQNDDSAEIDGVISKQP